MKTLFLCNLIPCKTGAFERFVAAAGRECAARGHRLDLVFADEPSPAVAELFRHAGLSWRLIRGWSDAEDRVNSRAFLAQAPRIVRVLRPDVTVVHFGNELPSLAVAAAARLAGCRTKWVWQQHQQVADPGPVARRVSRLRVLAAGFDHLIAVYDGGGRSLRLRGIPERKISVVYNGIVDHVPAREPGWLKKELGIPADAVIAACAGSLIARKRHEFILEAMASIAGRAPGLHLVIVGTGPREDELRRVTKSLNLAERVHGLGLRDDVRDILAESDFLVHASTAETCTYVISEAMAAAVPALVTEAGAAREQIEDGVTGFVTAVDDREVFRARLLELAGDPARRKALGRAARGRWESRYRLEETVKQYVGLLEHVAAGRVGE